MILPRLSLSLHNGSMPVPENFSSPKAPTEANNTYTEAIDIPMETNNANNKNSLDIAHSPHTQAPSAIVMKIKSATARKPRIFHNGRDMLLSLIPLGIICIAVAGLSGNLSFRFHQTSQYTPHYEAYPAAQAAAHQLPFAIRFPQLPPKWIPNSGSKANIHSEIVFNLGWLTPRKHFIQVTQSSVKIPDLIPYLNGNSEAEPVSSPIPGWQWYQKSSHQSFGISELPGETLAVSGNNATSEEFTVIIKAILASQPLSSK